MLAVFTGLLGCILFGIILLSLICRCCRCSQKKESNKSSRNLAIILLILVAVCLGLVVGCLQGNGKISKSVDTAVDGISEIHDTLIDILNSCSYAFNNFPNINKNIHTYADTVNEIITKIRNHSRDVSYLIYSVRVLYSNLQTQINNFQIHEMNTRLIQFRSKLQNVEPGDIVNITPDDIDIINDARHYADRVRFIV